MFLSLIKTDCWVKVVIVNGPAAARMDQTGSYGSELMSCLFIVMEETIVTLIYQNVLA